MQIKDKYKIGAHTFDVHFTTEIDGFSIKGEMHHWKHRINIQTDMVQSKQESTLFHEVFHEINLQQSWDFKENEVSRIAENFYTFLVDNDLLKGYEDERNT